MNYDIWKTLFTEDFNCNKYLYHYTSLENAKSILSTNQICFSPLKESNDFPEEKVRLTFFDKTNGVNHGNTIPAKQISAYLKKRHDAIQSLSFCCDYNFSKSKIIDIMKKHKNPSRDKYYDLTGRGFAIPFLWKKFNSNNCVCLIINKRKFEQFLEMDANILMHKKIHYIKFDNAYVINKNTLDELSDKIERFRKQKKSFLKLMTNDLCYLEYNFFYKKYDWQHENEYRYISIKPTSDKTVAISGLDKYLEGIIIKDSICKEDEQTINELVNKRCYINKITFNGDYCHLI